MTNFCKRLFLTYASGEIFSSWFRLISFFNPPKFWMLAFVNELFPCAKRSTIYRTRLILQKIARLVLEERWRYASTHSRVNSHFPIVERVSLNASSLTPLMKFLTFCEPSWLKRFTLSLTWAGVSFFKYKCEVRRRTWSTTILTFGRREMVCAGTVRLLGKPY